MIASKVRLSIFNKCEHFCRLHLARDCYCGSSYSSFVVISYGYIAFRLIRFRLIPFRLIPFRLVYVKIRVCLILPNTCSPNT